MWPGHKAGDGRICGGCWIASKARECKPGIKEIIERAEYEKAMEHQLIDFDPLDVRPSGIGLCGKKQVHSILHREMHRPILAKFAKLGHEKQDVLFEKTILKIYPNSLQELEIPMPVEGKFGHTDILVVDHEPSLCVEVKTCYLSVIKKFRETKEGLPHSWNIDQVMFGWHRWKKSGWVRDPGTKQVLEIPAPETFQLIYIARDDIEFEVFDVEYDSIRGEALEAEYLERNDHALMGTLPDRCFSEPNWQCHSSKSANDPCPLYSECWPDVPLVIGGAEARDRANARSRELAAERRKKAKEEEVAAIGDRPLN